MSSVVMSTSKHYVQATHDKINTFYEQYMQLLLLVDYLVGHIPLVIQVNTFVLGSHAATCESCIQHSLVIL